MAEDIPPIVARLVGDNSNFLSSLKDAVTGSEGAMGTITKVFAAGGVAAAAVAVKGLADFVGFQRQMNEVFTLMPGISGEAMGKMTDQVKSFSVEFGVLPEKVVPALYQSLSAGVPPDNVFAFLETAQKAAKGGVTDLTTAVDGISSVVNSYGSDVIDATKASDLMFTAVRLGKTNFEELSKSLFNVNPVASALGVEFSDVTAALAAMTAQGVPTSVATTQLRQLFVELSKEGGRTSETFEKIAGKGFKEFIAGGRTTQDALQLLETHAERTGVGINDLFGSVEAGGAALALTGKGTAALDTALAAMGESAGATDAAFKQMNTGLGPLIDKGKALAKVLLLEIGEGVSKLIYWLADKLGPTVKEVIGGVRAFAAAWKAFDGDITSSGFAGFMERVAFVGRNVAEVARDVLAVAFRVLADAVPVVVTVLGGLISVLSNPIFQVVAGIIATLLIPSLIMLGVHAAGAAAQTIFWWVAMHTQAIASTVGTVAQMAIQGAKWIWMGITALASGAQVALAWMIAMGPIALVVAAVVGAAILIVKNWDWIKETAGNVVGAIGGFLSNLIGWLVNFVQQWGVLLLGPIGAAWKFRDEIWGVVSAVLGFFGRLVAGAADKAWELVTLMWGIPGRIRSALGDLGGLLWNAGINLIEGLIGGIRNMAGRAASAAWNVVKGAIRSAWDALVPGSPSREGAKIGVNFGQGLVLGMEKMRGQVAGAAGGLIGDALGAAQGAAAIPAGTAIASSGGGARGGNTYIFQFSTATGVIPDEVMRQLRAQLFELENDMPSGQIVPAA